MKTRRSITPRRLTATALAVSAALALGACSSSDDDEDETAATETPATGEMTPGETPDNTASQTSVSTSLSPAAEVPAVVVDAPDATGTGTLTVDGDGAATGEVTVSGLTGDGATMAHIHRGFPGSAGPVVVGLENTGADNTTWTLPAGYSFEGDDLAAFRRGELYFNVHTAANMAGEVRGQIVPIGDVTTFTVRLENVGGADALNVPGEDGSAATAPVPLSPGAFVVHREATDSPLLLPRDMANAGLEGVAEDGNPGPYVADGTRVAGATVFNTPVDATEPGPATPGLAYEFEFTAVPGDKLGFVTMFVQSNDWFYTPTDDDNSIELFGEDGTPVSGDVTDQVALWDAGTEADETPGAGTTQVIQQMGELNIGPVDPDTSVGSLEARGQTAPDLNGPVIQVTITPAAP